VATKTSELHRRLQLALAATIARDVMRIWPAFDLANIGGTWPPVETALAALVANRAGMSAALAAAYFRRARIEALGESFDATLALPKAEQIITSLNVTGPVRAEKLVAAQNPKASERTLVSVVGSSMRLAMAGGRLTVAASLRSDPRARGWRRATSGSACAFCASRAGRFMTSEVVFEAHDHCHCTAEAVWQGSSGRPIAPTPTRQATEPPVTGNPIADLETRVAQLAGR
jgi:hypothetical protein